MTSPARPAAPTPPKKPDTAALRAELVAKHGAEHRARIERGVEQVAALWRPEDGDMAAFVREQFIADPKLLDATFARLERTFEQLDGHFNALGREVRWATDLDLGPLLPVDPLLSSYDPSAHVTEDLFQSKVGFVVLLNFPLTTLSERAAQARTYTRRQWAEARLTGRFNQRVPSDVRQQASRAASEADLYIAEYNIWMHHLVNEKGERLFPQGMRLITHWNLRDELKANYADKARRTCTGDRPAACDGDLTGCRPRGSSALPSANRSPLPVMSTVTDTTTSWSEHQGGDPMA